MTTLLEDIRYLTITELAGLLRTRTLSPVEVTRAQTLIPQALTLAGSAVHAAAAGRVRRGRR
jgi:hypothetical protein